MTTQTPTIYTELQESRPGFFSKIADTVSNFIAARREADHARRQAEKEDQLNRAFDVEERNGRLFITCQGVATQEIPATMSANEVIQALATARRSALKYNANK